jgi:hypothetical protein
VVVSIVDVGVIVGVVVDDGVLQQIVKQAKLSDYDGSPSGLVATIIYS